MEPAGPKPTEDLIDILIDVHEKPRTVSSDWARKWAPEVAAVASLGLITTRQGGAFGRSWRLTTRGLEEVEKE